MQEHQSQPKPVLPVAVVIPCFNDGRTLLESVESAHRERPAELVVVNDGSTDPFTLDVIRGLEARGVRVVTQPNMGLAAARMRGVKATSSPFVMVLDSDDKIAPGALSVMARHLEADRSLAVVWGDVERFGAAGYMLYRKGRSLDPWRITHVNELVASTLVRRDSLLAAGGWSLRSAFEDWDLWMAMAERGMNGRHVGRVTLYYRVDEPRMYRQALKTYGDLTAILRARHPMLFGQRRALRQTARAGVGLKFAWSAIDVVPLPATLKRYLYFGALILCEPSRRRSRTSRRGNSAATTSRGPRTPAT